MSAVVQPDDVGFAKWDAAYPAVPFNPLPMIPQYRPINRVPFRYVELPKSWRGILWLHSMPGRDESLEVFRKWAHLLGIRHVVCLPKIEELEEKFPEYHRFRQEKDGSDFLIHDVGIPDFSVPDDPVQFKTVIKTISEFLVEDDHPVLIHCAAGIGRTGMFTACLLKAMGCGTEWALELTGDAGSSPETPAQRKFVEEFRFP